MLNRIGMAEIVMLTAIAIFVYIAYKVIVFLRNFISSREYGANKSNTVMMLGLIVSLLFNINQIRYIKSINHQNRKISNYMKYVAQNRLNRQRWICESISLDLDKIKNGDMTVDELTAYLSGVREFTHPDLVEGVFNETYSSNSDILKLLKKFMGSGNIIKDSLVNLSSKDIDELIEKYDRLVDLLDGNKKENSIIYYIEKDELDNPQFIEMIDEIDVILDEIDAIYGNGEL